MRERKSERWNSSNLNFVLPLLRNEKERNKRKNSTCVFYIYFYKFFNPLNLPYV